MKDTISLTIVRTTHTIIYVVMAFATFILFYAGTTGSYGPWLYVALVLLGIESVIFIGNGMKCPLTKLAVKYSAEKGYAFDTFLPERFTRYTFRFFGTIMVASLILLAATWVGLIV